MNFNRIGLKSFLGVLDAVSWNKPCELDVIVAFSGLSRPTVVNSLKNAIELGIIRENNKQFIIKDEFEKNLSLESKKVVVRRILQGWAFFQQLCCFLANSKSSKEAIRKTLAITKLEFKWSSSVENILILATELEVLTVSKGDYQLTEEIMIAPHETTTTISSLNSEMAIIIFLSKKLSPEFFHTLGKPEQERLTMSLMYYVKDPEKSCECAGQALENYLRVVGVTAGEDLTSCDGIGQIADYLSAKTRLIIHPRHRDISKSISTIRNSSAHDRDKLTGDPWIKTSETALINSLLVIQLIKSINLWVTSKGQIV